MADDDKDWEDVPAKKSGGTATATADGDWEDVPAKQAATPTAAPAPETKEPSFIDKALRFIPEFRAAGDLSGELGKVGDWAQKKAEEKQTELLGNIAKGTATPPKPTELGSSASDAYDLLARTARMGSGATSPTNVAIGVAAMLAPEIVAPALIAHGGYGAIKSGQDIAEHGLTPENTEQGLGSLAEAAGGGAALGEIPKAGGLKNTLTGKAVSKGLEATGGAGLGLGLPPEDLITKGVRPRARAQGWQDAIQSPGVQRAIKEADATAPIKNVEDFHDAIGPMKEKLWNEQVQPALDRQGPRPVDMKPAAQAVRDAITPTMREFNPSGVAALEDLAGKLEKSRTVSEANELQKYANGQLEVYHAKYPTARRAAMNSNPDTLGWETARRAIREQLNGTLEDAGETQTADARKDYGHLTAIEKELERKVNPNERKAPINLARTLGLIGAIPTHGASILAGEVISHMNDPNVLLRRGIAKMNPPAAAPFTPPEAFKPPAPPAQIPRIAGEQQPLNLPPENAPLFNIQQTPKLKPDFEEPRLGQIHGEQQPLGLAPPEAPLFNIQQTPNPTWPNPGAPARAAMPPVGPSWPEPGARARAQMPPLGPVWPEPGAPARAPLPPIGPQWPEPGAPPRAPLPPIGPQWPEPGAPARAPLPPVGPPREGLGAIGGPGREGTLGRIGETKSVAPSPVESVKLPHPEVTDLKPGESTSDRFYNKDTDEWSPEREANHEAVAEAAIKGKTPPTDRPPEAVITMGGTASGKTTLTRQILGADKNRVNVDSDTNKLSIPEYEGLKDSDPENAAARVHEESKAISRRTIQKAVEKGLDFIYDTSTGGGGEKLFKKLKDLGYNVRVVYADVPVEEALKRSEERAKNSEDPSNRDRIIPEDVVRQKHQEAAKAFTTLRNSPHVDEVQAFDTTTRNPEKFYSRQGQKETVHNPKVLDRIKEKANGQTTAAK
jgi:Zeta toxin